MAYFEGSNETANDNALATALGLGNSKLYQFNFGTGQIEGTATADGKASASTSGKIPWWAWILGGVVLLGGIYLWKRKASA